MSVEREGGCLCGAVRYRIGGEPLSSGYCHCRICRRVSGGPAVAWAEFPRANHAIIAGEPSRYRSSERGYRQYCDDCGTHLDFVFDAGPEATMAINLGTLDDPEAIAPDRHIWTRSRIGWFHIGDDLPRYPEDGPAS